jgi:hypothetical protein
MRRFFAAGHFVISMMFVLCAGALIVLAVVKLWQGIIPGASGGLTARLQDVLESIAQLTVALASLELGQTVLEEEVLRAAHISAPTRVRRFLSRFMIVLVVALSIESLVIVFRVSHDTPEQLPYAASVGLAAAALLAAWGVFVRLNRAAEELEPEAMAEAKREDDNLDELNK